MFHRTLWLGIILLIGSAFAADVPFVFEEGYTGFAAYSSAQLEQAYAASPDLKGVPFTSTPSNDEILEFPVAGGSSSSAGKTEKKAEEINKTLNSRVEPDNTRVHDLALALAAEHSGDYTVDQVCEIYSYLKYGNSTKKPWSYARDPRGVDYFNFASKSLSAGDDAKCAGAGDCDDFAILMSSLVESIGGTTRIILARNNSTGGHAYAEVYIGRLSDPNDRVEETVKWLQQEYDTEKIFTHIETDAKDVWLNLDWGNDAKGNAHPGGPFFQGDRHYVLCIRDKYGKTAVKPPEKANKPPKLVSLTADKNGPQQAGAVITWTAEARDADKDPVLYRFFLNDDPVTKWAKENHWVWTTTEDDLGESQIEVQVRDGKHAGPDKYDANMGTGFAIKAPQSVPQISANQSNLAVEWNNKGDAPVASLSVANVPSSTTASVGECVTYLYTVKNTGKVTINGLTLTDDKLGSISLDKSSLVPGDTAMGSATYLVAEMDLPGPLTNLVTAEAKDSMNLPFTTTATATVALTYNVAIGVTMSPSATSASVGESVTYLYTAKNTGKVTINDLTLTDDKLGSISLDKSSLVPGDTAMGSATYLVAEMDLPGPLTNIVTVAATDSQNQPVTTTATATVTLTYVASLSVAKVPSSTTARVGDRITYTYTVSNTGKVTINGLTLTDDKLGSISLDKSSLVPGDTAMGSATYLVAEMDLPGPLTNLVTAEAKDSMNLPVTTTATATVALTYG